METISEEIQLRVGVIGLGRIGGAALRQWEAAGYDVTGFGRESDLSALADIDVIALTFDPQSLDEAGLQLREHVTERHIVLSFLAGKTACTLSEVLGTSRVGRTMTNYNLLVGQAMTAWFAKEDTFTGEEEAAIEALLRCLGKTMRLTSEDSFNTYTTKGAGSTPAIFAHIVGLMERAMQADGLSRDDARFIALQTIKGTVATLESGVTAQDLEGSVKTPGGATWMIFETLKECGWDDEFLNALEVGRQRCEVLGQKS